MTFPWDQPPLAKEGEPTFIPLFQSVGQFITGWEYLEFKISRIHSLFCGAPDDWPAIRSYGRETTYNRRIQEFTRKRDEFFMRRPCQELEGEVAYIRAACDGFSLIRNDIAHGVVFECGQNRQLRNALGLPDRKPQYLLIPPMQTIKKYSGPALGAPLYAYDSEMIGRAFNGLHELQLRIDKTGARLFASVSTSPAW